MYVYIYIYILRHIYPNEKDPLSPHVSQRSTADAASIPGMDAPSASAGDVSAMSTAEVGGAGAMWRLGVGLFGAHEIRL